MSTNAFALLRKVIPEERADDLFIVGDGHQRIYRRKVVLGRAGINERGRRGRKLRINYRTTEEIRKFAVSLLEGVVADDLDGGDDTTKGCKSLMRGEAPRVESLPSFDAEVAAIADWLKAGVLEQTCLVARTNDWRDKYAAALEKRGFHVYALKRSEAEDTSKSGLRAATMHRVKGLEFARVVIAGVNEGLVPSKDAVEKSADPAVRNEAEELERALLYVAATRAKKDVLITSWGKPSKWV